MIRMRALLILELVLTLHRESWKMYMADCGIKTDVYGHVSPQEFVKYRALVENRNKPLLPELVTMQMSPLPKPQLLWSKVKLLIKEVIDHRYNNNGILRVTAPRAANLADGKLLLNLYVLLLHNSWCIICGYHGRAPHDGRGCVHPCQLRYCLLEIRSMFYSLCEGYSNVSNICISLCFSFSGPC